MLEVKHAGLEFLPYTANVVLEAKTLSTNVVCKSAIDIVVKNKLAP